MSNNTDSMNPDDRTLQDHRLVKPRFTLARLMIVIAVVAGLLALVRSSAGLAVYLLWLTLNFGVGWMAWMACRRRRWLVPRIHLTIIGLGLGLAWLSAYLGDTTGARRLPFFLIVLVYPIILGSGLAWLTHASQDLGKDHVVIHLFILVMIGLPLLAVLPTYFVLFVFTLHPWGGFAPG